MHAKWKLLKAPGFHGESEFSPFSSKEYHHILIWINELNPMGFSRWLGKINSDVFYTKNIHLRIYDQSCKIDFVQVPYQRYMEWMVKKSRNIIPLSYLFVCSTKSVCSVVCVVVRLPGYSFSFSFLLFFSELLSSSHQVFTSAFPRAFCTVLLSLLFLFWGNTCITWLASWKRHLPFKT